VLQPGGFSRDDDHSPPDQLVSKHAEDYAIPVAEIIDPRIEPKASSRHTA
jgi:hypothetical protein